MPALLVVVISPHRQIWVLVFAAFISIAPGLLGARWEAEGASCQFPGWCQRAPAGSSGVGSPLGKRRAAPSQIAEISAGATAGGHFFKAKWARGCALHLLLRSSRSRGRSRGRCRGCAGGWWAIDCNNRGGGGKGRPIRSRPRMAERRELRPS
jgi:hypothetical protein